MTQLVDVGGDNGTLLYSGCPSGKRIVGYAGLETCAGPNLVQVCSDPCRGTPVLRLLLLEKLLTCLDVTDPEWKNTERIFRAI